MLNLFRRLGISFEFKINICWHIPNTFANDHLFDRAICPSYSSKINFQAIKNTIQQNLKNLIVFLIQMYLLNKMGRIKQIFVEITIWPL